MGDPKLPPEIERVIFESVAFSHPVRIPNLMQVAWRVKDWVEPLLYRVIIVMPASTSGDSLVPICRPEILLRLISTKPPLFFHFHVKTLHVEGIFPPQSEVIIPQILAACTGVTSLVVAFGIIPHLSALNTLKSLSSLSINVRPLLEYYPKDFPQAMFHDLTHLQIQDSLWEPEATQAFCTGLTLMSRLTHLSFNSVRWIDRLHLGLRNAPLQRLMCIVLLCSPDGERRNHWPSSDDPRFVCIGEENYWVDWQRGALTGKNYWTLAEAFIAAKRAGEICVPWGRAPDRMRDGWWIR
ncbi:hypothetical protein MVEN_01590100 [Mycena venus]|uniref:Uncharacterized protein n=1 Tax=Mycena venus TaxID=2733690 RepID=A0A8H7CRP4_9AGAR|nr:hypothetical protein MVEN_01590100 [Mycena venus]